MKLSWCESQREVSLMQFIIILMEQHRRNLRNYNKCQQTNNIFNIKTNENHITRNMPPQILAQIGKLQKISCCNINNLPELNPQLSIEQELKKCLAAQQPLLPSSTFQNHPIYSSPGPKEHTQKQGVTCPKTALCKEECESIEQIHLMEKEQNHESIWKDVELVDKLNQYFMFGGNDRGRMSHELFQK